MQNIEEICASFAPNLQIIIKDFKSYFELLAMLSVIIFSVQIIIIFEMYRFFMLYVEVYVVPSSSK